MSELLTLSERIEALRRSASSKLKTGLAVEPFSWESFLTQYNQLDVEVRDELEDFQQFETVENTLSKV